MELNLFFYIFQLWGHRGRAASSYVIAARGHGRHGEFRSLGACCFDRKYCTGFKLTFDAVFNI